MMNNEIMLEKIKSLELKISKLEDEVRLKNQCLSLIAHDFSGVSRNLQWVLNSLIDGDLSFEIFRSLYPELKANVESNQGTIESTIKWINSQHDTFKIQAEEIRLFDLFSSIKDGYKVQLENKSLDLLFEGDRDLEIRTDRVLLHFILKSIIGNAIKYSHRDGKIIFDVQLTDNKNISFIIEDFGVGMSQQVIDGAFTVIGSPYTGTDNEKGAGLNLVIVNDLIKLMEGTINVTSKENHGTKFELQLQNVL